MVTLYQLLGVEEDASKEEIKNAYDVRIKHPALDESKKNKVRMAAEILLNDAKREKYNKDLADYRAQELLKNISFSNSLDDAVDVTVDDDVTEEKEEVTEETLVEQENNTVIDNNVVENEETVYEEETESESTAMNEISNDIFNALNENKAYNEKLSEEERIREEEARLREAAAEKKREELRELEKKVNQKEYEKILKKQEALDKKQMKKAQREYKERYQEAYVNELRNRGYNVKYPWTRKRVKNLLIGIFATVLTIFILWQIPMVREPLIELYNENSIIKTVVDVFASFIKAIFSVFKSE